MFKSFLGVLVLVVCASLGASSAWAEDIDIFGGPASNGATPNILILLDTSASNDASFGSPACPYPGIGNSKLMDQVQCALATAVDGIKSQPALLGKLNIGLMIYGTGSNQGGMWVNPSLPVGTAPTSLPNMNTTGINSFLSLVEAGYSKSNSRSGPSIMQEAWAFFAGKVGQSGTSYASHVTLSCQKSFIIFIGAAAKQGNPGTQGNGNVSLVDTGTYTVGASTAQKTQINTTIAPNRIGNSNGDDGAWTDEWARFLFQSDFGDPTLSDKQNIVTYTIAATGGDPDADYVQHLASMAKQGGGKSWVAADANAIVQALLNVFNEVASVNTVFSSVSLPLSTNTQGAFANQVFIGMFRPDASSSPRWKGNLKLYEFGVDTSDPTKPTVFLADSGGNPAISSTGSGFISPNAVSFWNRTKDTLTLPDSLGGFWVNDPRGTPASGFDTPDGEVVEKGGASFRIRIDNLQDNYASPNETTPRKVYTCIGTSCVGGASLSTMNFATNNTDITAAVLGVNGPAMAITQIVRSATTTATVTLASAPSPALTSGQSVTISGSQYPEFNGTFSITPVTTTTFTYTVTVDPPTPAAGTYTATVPSNPKTITSLTRQATTVTATVANTFVNGQTVTITGATGTAYNGTFVVSGATASSFQYTITDGPTTPDGGGTAKVGSTTLTIPSGGIVRNASNTSNVSEVTVTLAVNVPFAVGNTVTIAGAGPGGVSPYNGNWAITKLGTSCAGGSKSGSNPRSFCFNMNTTPVSPDPGAGIKADGATTPVTIITSGLTHAASTCASNATVLATAVTSTAPTFVAGETVSVGGTPGANEGAYVGSFVVQSVKITSPYNFTYNIVASPGSSTSCADATTNMTASAQGVTKDTLIRWVRGEDNAGDEASPGGGITIRGSVHGDVLHSRPAVYDYGGSTGIVVFYGANDGEFRAVNGNKTASIGSVGAGGELWSFIPTEFYNKLQRLYFASPIIHLSSTPTGLTPKPAQRDYFFDGSSTVFKDATSGKVYLYLTARRGGRLLYAFDVTTATDPKFLWKVGCPNTTDNTGCSSSSIQELGQTWSLPTVANVKGYTAHPVLIFGAGYYGYYDSATLKYYGEDDEPPYTNSLQGPRMGRGIFVLDAVTGAVVWRAGPGGSANKCSANPCLLQDMTYAIPADITLVDHDKPVDGFVDRAYAADTGGQIWRIDFEPNAGNAPANWQVTKFADLGGTSTTKRKFLYPPDFAKTTNFDLVIAGTGDREHPTYSNDSRNIVNRFYMLKDTRIGKDANSPTDWIPIADATSGTADTPPDPSILFNATSSPYPSTFPGSGFYVTMTHTGEKFANGPSLLSGFVYFGTNTPTQPVANSCSNGLGDARGYAINVITGASNSVLLDGGGLPPPPVTGYVEVSINGQPVVVPFQSGAGNPDPTCVGSDCKSPLAPGPGYPKTTAKRSRVYWYIEKHDN